MTIIEMLEQSTILTVLGMTIVFVFLWLMIICINAVGKLVCKLGWDRDIRQPRNDGSQSKHGTAAEITAAISAALVEHRERNRP